MQINWMSNTLNPNDGYGRWNMAFIRALKKLCVDVNPIDLRTYRKFPAWMKNDTGYDFKRVTISCSTGDEFREIPGRQWGFTMCEVDRVDPKWVNLINRHCERLLVPCQHNKIAFETSGVNVPVHIVPGGIDLDEFPFFRSNQEQDYTFLVLGDRGVRKGLEIVWGAFHRAFGGDPKRFADGEPHVRLLIKVRPRFATSLSALQNADSRVSVWCEEVPLMRNVYEKVNCFCIPSFGEGYGLPHREAAAMGIPVITTRWGGLDDHLDEWAIPINNFKLVRANDPNYPKDAKWAYPDVNEVAEKMRWCFDNRKQAESEAFDKAVYLRTHQTWFDAACKLTELLRMYG